MKIINKKVKDVVFQTIEGVHTFEIIFEDDTKTSINWKDGQYGIDNIACNMLSATLNKWGQKKNSIANEYAINGRQVMVFLNEMIGLNLYIAHEKNWQKLVNIANADELMHNRVIAQLLYEYNKRGINTSIILLKKNSKKYDLNLGQFQCEVKTILPERELEITEEGFKLTDVSYSWLSRKIAEKFDDAKEQVGLDGIIIISPWSHIINALLRSYFQPQITKNPPNLEKGIVILVLYSEKPLEYYYLKLPNDDFISIILKALSDIQKGVKGTINMQSLPITLTTAPEKGSSASLVLDIPFTIPRDNEL